MTNKDVLDFWFKECSPNQWWGKNVAFDQSIRERFSHLHQKAISGELFEWRSCASGRLAEIIVIDQFSRNMFRDTPKAFAYDSIALVLSQEGISLGADKKLSPVEKLFFYMPFMHSESREIHTLAMALYAQPGLEKNFEFEVKHKKIIDQFGRYPHRNEILKRHSTEEEIAFLKMPDSSF